MKIALNHNLSLEITAVPNKLRVRRSLKQPTSLEVKPDGLYAEQQSGSGTGGFPDQYQSDNMIRSGVMYASDRDVTHCLDKRVAAFITAHRVFTCTQSDGSDIDLRQSTLGGTTHNIDMILPGDMYRVLDTTNNVYKYYLVLKTNGNSVTMHTTDPVASIPVSESCN